MERQGARLAAVVSAFSAAARSGSTAELGALLDAGVVWQGLLPELACSNRRQVIGRMGRALGRGLEVTRLDAEEVGDAVAISVAGPGLPENGALAAGAPRSLVLRFAGDKVVRIESFATREEALRSAASPAPGA